MKAILRMTIDERRSVVRSGILLWIKEGYKAVAPKLPQISSKSFVCPSYPNGQSGIKFAILDDEVGLRFETSGENEFNRYYGQCVTTRCVYWKGHCQLGAIVATSAERTPESFTLLSIDSPDYGCPIQSICRWRNENGELACIGCQGVAYSS